MDGDLRTLPEPTVTGAPREGRGRAAAALISVCLGFFVIQLDVTIVNVALPAIQGEIGGSLAGLQWVVDAYTLALSGGALGVAVLGSLLGRGYALSLHVPLLVATAGYLVAIALAWTTIRAGRERRVTS
jgi:MFS family permease